MLHTDSSKMEQSSRLSLQSQTNRITARVDEDTIQPPPDDYDDHPLIDPMIEGGRGRLFPIVLVWVHPTRCSFYYQTALNVAGSGQNVFGPRATFALYKKNEKAVAARSLLLADRVASQAVFLVNSRKYDHYAYA